MRFDGRRVPALLLSLLLTVFGVIACDSHNRDRTIHHPAGVTPAPHASHS